MSPAYVLGLVVGRLVGPLVTGVVDGMFGAPDDVNEAYTPIPVPPVPAPVAAELRSVA